MSNAGPSPTQSEPESPLRTLHQQWALGATRKLELIHPALNLTLYRIDWRFIVHVDSCTEEVFRSAGQDLEDVRPATCDLTLSRQVPPSATLIPRHSEYSAEVWLSGAALPVPLLNNLLSLAEPHLPEGRLDFNLERQGWEFRSLALTTETERTRLRLAATKIGVSGPVEFVQVTPSGPPAPAATRTVGPDKLTLITARNLPRGSRLRDLVEQDEDQWRGFLARRANRELVAPDRRMSSGFTCLYDVEHCGASRLSELLTLYDRLELIPERSGLEWLTKHQVPLEDLQELARLNRVRIILPYSVADYPSRLVDAMTEVEPSAVILSRSLAASTIARGQAKEPLLYAPLSSRERVALLAAFSRSATDPVSRSLLGSYGRLFSQQHDMFMMRGALASLGYGVGAYLGEVYFNLGRKDARLELMTCGAGIEWALGLGSSYIPRDFAGFDETRNSHIIASYLSRTKFRAAEPVADRLHTVVDGLLAVSGVPPLEIARNFQSLPASRFRTVARSLMAATSSASELQETIEQVNADVRAFERRSDRLSHWKIGTVLTHGVAAIVDNLAGVFTSMAAMWLCDQLGERLPDSLRAELADARAILTSLATASSLDAVVVSRSRKAVRNIR